MPPGAISPNIMFRIGTPPPSGVNESCIESTAPVDVRVVAFAKSAEDGTPKRTSLPSIAAPAAWSAAPECWASNVVTSVSEAAKITAIADEDRPALALVAEQLAEGARQRERDQQQQHDLEQVREGVGVLERVRGVGVVGAAAVGAELLDRLLAGHRPAREVLGGTGDRGDRVRVGEVLHRRRPRSAGPSRRCSAGAGSGSTRGSGRPRSCRPGWSATGRSRAPARRRRPCRPRPRRSSAPRGRPSGPGSPWSTRRSSSASSCW